MKKTSLALAFLLLATTGLPVVAQQTLPTPAQATAVSQGVQEAVKLAQGGNLTAAIKKLEDLRKQTPVASPPLLSLLGTLYLQANRPQDALSVLKPMADAPNAEAAVLYNAGRAAYAIKQKDLWISYLKRAATIAPNSPAARDLGLVFMRQGQVVEAYSLLRHWSMANPNDNEARIAAASLAVQLERPTEAEELLLNLKQDDPAIHLLRGRIQVQKGDGAGALALLEPLLAKHPKGMDLEVRRSLSEAYLLANRPADTVKVLTGKTGNHPALSCSSAARSIAPAMPRVRSRRSSRWPTSCRPMPRRSVIRGRRRASPPSTALSWSKAGMPRRACRCSKRPRVSIRRAARPGWLWARRTTPPAARPTRPRRARRPSRSSSPPRVRRSRPVPGCRRTTPQPWTADSRAGGGSRLSGRKAGIGSDLAGASGGSQAQRSEPSAGGPRAGAEGAGHFAQQPAGAGSRDASPAPPQPHRRGPPHQ